MGKKKPLVSVVIPSYNSAEYLAATLDSVLAQKGAGSLFQQEIIVVDDGSTDNTQAVVEGYGERVIYHKIENSGRPAVPRNIGLKKAKGEYVAFLDSDDIWLPAKLKGQIEILNRDPKVILVSSNAEKIDAKGIKMGGLVVIEQLLPREPGYSELLKNNFICTSATVARRDTLVQMDGFDEKPELKAVEDYELWLRIAAKGKIAYQVSPNVLYRVHDSNISRAGELLATKRLVSVYKSVAKKVDKDNKGASLRALSAAYYFIATMSHGLNQIIYKLAAKATSLHARLLYN